MKFINDTDPESSAVRCSACNRSASACYGVVETLDGWLGQFCWGQGRRMALSNKQDEETRKLEVELAREFEEWIKDTSA